MGRSSRARICIFDDLLCHDYDLVSDLFCWLSFLNLPPRLVGNPGKPICALSWPNFSGDSTRWGGMNQCTGDRVCWYLRARADFPNTAFAKRGGRPERASEVEGIGLAAFRGNGVNSLVCQGRASPDGSGFVIAGTLFSFRPYPLLPGAGP